MFEYRFIYTLGVKLLKFVEGLAIKTFIVNQYYDERSFVIS